MGGERGREGEGVEKDRGDRNRHRRRKTRRSVKVYYHHQHDNNNNNNNNNYHFYYYYYYYYYYYCCCCCCCLTTFGYRVMVLVEAGYNKNVGEWARKTEKQWKRFVGCLLTIPSKQHVPQGRICSDNCTCCHTDVEVPDQTFYLNQSYYTDTGPASPNAVPITPGAWQGSHWSANLQVTGMTRPGIIPAAQAGIKLEILRPEVDALTTRPTRRFVCWLLA